MTVRSSMLGFALVFGTFAVSAYSVATLAQNMQVVGGSSIAQECFRASSVAAASGSARQADVDSCTKALRHGSLKQRDAVATYVNRGVIYVALENYQAAAKDYNRAIGLKPNVPEAYVNRGNLWFIASHYQQAIADYDRALDLGFSEPHIAHLNRGMVREILGQYDLAKQDYLAALNIHADWDRAQEKLQRVNQKITRQKSK